MNISRFSLNFRMNCRQAEPQILIFLCHDGTSRRPSTTVESAAWWYITMERTCQAQLLAEAAGKPVPIDPENCEITYKTVGSELAGWFQYQPLLSVISAEQPDMYD